MKGVSMLTASCDTCRKRARFGKPGAAWRWVERHKRDTGHALWRIEGQGVTR